MALHSHGGMALQLVGCVRGMGRPLLTLLLTCAVLRATIIEAPSIIDSGHEGQKKKANCVSSVSRRFAAIGMPRPPAGSEWRLVATGLCQESSSVRERMLRFKTKWLPAFTDGGSNPQARWGQAGGRVAVKYFECRAHTDCTRCLRVTNDYGDDLVLQAYGRHSTQVQDIDIRMRPPRLDVITP